MVQRLFALIDAAPDAIISVDSAHRIIVFNRAACETFGWSEDEVLGRPLSILLPEHARGAHPAQIDVFVAEEPAWRTMAGQRRNLSGQRKDGTLFPAEVTISKVFLDEEWQFTAIVRDVSERNALRSQITRLTHHDALTGLRNRRLLQETMTGTLHTLRPGRVLAVMVVDVDRFKRVNDALGHQAGDTLLAQFATRLQANIRGEDSLGRLGGDEFVVLAGCQPYGEGAIAVAARLAQAWTHPFIINGEPITVTASIGISQARSLATSPDDVLREADIALRRAKNLGNNRVEVFDQLTGGSAASRLDLERGLEHAGERGEFDVHYQPVVSLNDATVTGFEALVRWQHDGRQISPAEFIPIAEETGQIICIGAWVLDQACTQAVAFAQAAAGRELDIAVNLSVRQVTDPTLGDHLVSGSRQDITDLRPITPSTASWLSAADVRRSLAAVEAVADADGRHRLTP